MPNHFLPTETALAGLHRERPMRANRSAWCPRKQRATCSRQRTRAC